MRAQGESPHLFLEDLCIGAKQQNQEFITMSGNDILESFKTFMQKRHVREDAINKWNHKTFAMEMKKITQDVCGIVKVSHSNRSMYKITIEGLESFLKKKGLCNDLSYMFRGEC